MIKLRNMIIVFVVALVFTGWYTLHDETPLTTSSKASTIKTALLKTEQLSENQSNDNLHLLNEQILAQKVQHTRLVAIVNQLVTSISAIENKMESIVVTANSNPDLESPLLIESVSVLLQENPVAISESYSETMDNEDIDSVWSMATENKIANLIAGDVLKGSDLINASCRSTICYVEVRHVNDQQFNKFDHVFDAELGWDNESFTRLIQDPNGGVRSVVYFSRDKHMLPNS